MVLLLSINTLLMADRKPPVDIKPAPTSTATSRSSNSLPPGQE
jgi:hypothetical protein